MEVEAGGGGGVSGTCSGGMDAEGTVSGAGGGAALGDVVVSEAGMTAGLAASEAGFLPSA